MLNILHSCRAASIRGIYYSPVLYWCSICRQSIRPLTLLCSLVL